MKFIKNNLKVIIAFVLGAILTGGIVYAAVSASEVSYTTNKNANVKSVEDALNDLYAKTKEDNMEWQEITDAFITNPNYRLYSSSTKLLKKGDICKISFAVDNITKNTSYTLITNPNYYPAEEISVFGYGYNYGMANVTIKTDGTFMVTNQSINWGNGWSAIQNICYKVK